MKQNSIVNHERSTRRVFLRRAAGLAAGATLLSQAPQLVGAEGQTVFGVVGDYGKNNGPEGRVANLIRSWNPSFVATTGDNVYTGLNAQTTEVLRTKVGKFYGQYVDNGTFFPSLGNHDWGHPGTPMLACDIDGCFGAWNDYFKLPGNGRYYDVRKGNVHLFVLDDYYLEPDGNSVNSKQAEWLRTTAAASNAPWKIVVHHFGGYGSFGQFTQFRWPFEQWGIDAVFSGHHHAYERMKIGNIPYIITGTGGAGLNNGPQWTHPDRKSLHIKRYGAMRGKATATAMTVEMIDVDGVVLDRVDLVKDGANPPPPPPPPEGGDNGNPENGVPSVSKAGPGTIITSPTAGQRTGKTPLIEGWATSGKGVSHVNLVIRHTDTNTYWNESTRSTQTKFFLNRVEVKTRGDQVTVWSYRNGGKALPAGNYVARAWTKALNGDNDPFGTAIVEFNAS